MNILLLRAGLAVAFTCCGGLVYAAPPLDKDPVGFLRFIETSPSLQARSARRQVAAGPTALARERAEARKEGIAVFPVQLNRPLPPAALNAAPLYLRAEALRRGKLRLPNHAETLSARYAYTPAQLTRVQQIYNDNQEAIVLLHQATDRPQCVFARDWAKDTFNYSSQFAGMREAARELKTEGVLEAERGRYGEAATTEGRVYRVAKHAAGEPTLISYLVAEAIASIATGGMQDILTLAGPSADIDAQVEQALTAPSASLSLRHALSGEVALGDAGFSLLRRGGPAALGNLVGDGPSAPRPASVALTPRDRRFYADLLDAAEADYIHNVRAAIRRADTFGEAAAFARASREAQAPTNDLVQAVSRRLSPLQFEILNSVPMRSAASRQVTRAAAAVLAARAKTGAYPEALPGVFTDPYTGKPPVYRREGADGFVVYSAGPDGKYDGGKPGDEASAGEVRFRYPTVPVPVSAADER